LLTYLSMKQGCLFVCLFVLFCFVPMRSTKSGWFRSHSWFFRKLSRRSASAWFHGVWTCGVKVLEYWMISSLKIKLNHIEVLEYWMISSLKIKLNHIEVLEYWMISSLKIKLNHIEVLEYWMIFSLKIKLNKIIGANFQRNWNVPLVLLERSW
jgi:hypothetical protein